jgi:hypothetical protein
VHIVACGIFKAELDRILPAIRRELPNQDIRVTFLSPGLHVDCARMEKEIVETLKSLQGEKLLLYGTMCHEKLASIAHDNHAALPSDRNCIEMIVSPEKKKALDESGNIFYVTAGWLQSWREILQERAASCDKIIVLDAGGSAISEEALLEFFDFMQIPVETVEVTLDYFKNKLTHLCKQRSG